MTTWPIYAMSQQFAITVNIVYGGSGDDNDDFYILLSFSHCFSVDG